MKIFVLFFIIILLSMAFSFVIDFMMAIKLSIAIQNLKKPFLVMTYPEYLIGFAFLLTFVLPPIYIYLKKESIQERHKKGLLIQLLSDDISSRSIHLFPNKIHN